MSDTEKPIISQIKDSVAECLKASLVISSQIARLENAISYPDDRCDDEVNKPTPTLLVGLTEDAYSLQTYLEVLVERITLANNKIFGE